MVKHTQLICRLKPTDCFEFVRPFWGVRGKRVKHSRDVFTFSNLKMKTLPEKTKYRRLQ